jgi:hypothetical protein
MSKGYQRFACAVVSGWIVFRNSPANKFSKGALTAMGNFPSVTGNSIPKSFGHTSHFAAVEYMMPSIENCLPAKRSLPPKKLGNEPEALFLGLYMPLR